jgi:hypothetical protein
MAFKLNTLHIFGYGEVQIIGQDDDIKINKKVPNDTMISLQAVVDNVYSFKPTNNLSPNVYHAINIFVDMFADYNPKDSAFVSWRAEFKDLDNLAIDTLVAEILAF